MEAKLATQALDVATPGQTVRCGLCLRLVEGDIQIGGICAHEGCEEILCQTCWRLGDKNLCHKHSPSCEQQYEFARRELAAGRLTILVSAHQARQRELNFISRFDRKVRQMITLRNPIGDALYRYPVWGEMHTTSDANLGARPFLTANALDGKALAALPLNSSSTYVLRGQKNAIILEARALSRLERYITDGFDTHPLGVNELLGHLADAMQAISSRSVQVYVLGLASTTGWADEAMDYVDSAEPGRAFAHCCVLLCLVDLESGHVFCNPFDMRMRPFIPLYAALLPEEEIQVAARAIRAELLRHESVTLSQAAAVAQVAENVIRQAFDRLAATGEFVVTDVPGVGPTITRR